MKSNDFVHVWRCVESDAVHLIVVCLLHMTFSVCTRNMYRRRQRQKLFYSPIDKPK